MSWTDERVATLKKLWADGLSASLIAAELGGVTRNAVIGKVHRLGLSGRAKTNGGGPKRTKKRVARSTNYNTKTRTQNRVPATTRDNSVAAVARRPVIDLVAPESKKLSLVELTEKTCKWPHGDPATDDFHFCGHSIKDDGPYCAYHSEMAFQPTADRRREKRAVNQ